MKQTDLELCDLRNGISKREEGKETQQSSEKEPHFGFVINKSIRSKKEVQRVKYCNKFINIFVRRWFGIEHLFFCLQIVFDIRLSRKCFKFIVVKKVFRL